MAAYTGVVKSYDENKMYGFITADNYPRAVFVKWDAISNADGGFRVLFAGQRVEFDIEECPKGPEARNVVKLS